MFLFHQIVNVLINPIFDALALLALGWGLSHFGRKQIGRGLCVVAGVALFLMSWPPFVDLLGISLERDYPALKAEDCPAVDAIVVLGGGVGMPPPEVEYPYPGMSEAADRVWHGARLWHAQRAQWPEQPVKIYCTGPDVSLHTPLLLKDFGVSADLIIPLDGPLNTEEEARRCEKELPGKEILLVTSALHMKRSVMIFRKYAPSLKVLPAATDHQFIDWAGRFRRWQYYFPSITALNLSAAIEHELIGILRYIW